MISADGGLDHLGKLLKVIVLSMEIWKIRWMKYMNSKRQRVNKCVLGCTMIS